MPHTWGHPFRVLTNGSVRWLYVGTMLAELVTLGAIMKTLPFLRTAEFGVPAVMIGAITTATTLVSVLVSAQNGRLARWLSNWGLIGRGSLLFGSSLIGIGLAR